MTRRAIGSVSVTLLLAAALAAGVPSTASATGGWQEFEGSGFGFLADGGGGSCPNPGAPRDVTFAVAGMADERLADVRVTDLRISHQFAGDVTVTLIAPDGVTQRVLLGRTGAATASGVGDGSNLAGPYTFTDDPAGPGDWWAAAAAVGIAEVIPSGEYYASQPGGADASRGTAASLTGAFAALWNPNGTWTLRVVDNCSPDAGSVVAARLVLRTVSQVCADEEAAVAAATTRAGSAGAGRVGAAQAVRTAERAQAKAATAVRKARKAVRKAAPAKRPAARIVLARKQLAQVRAQGRLALAQERARVVAAAHAAALQEVARHQVALDACRADVPPA